MELMLLTCYPKNRDIFLGYPGGTREITRGMKREAEEKARGLPGKKDPTHHCWL